MSNDKKECDHENGRYGIYKETYTGFIFTKCSRCDQIINKKNVNMKMELMKYHLWVLYLLNAVIVIKLLVLEPIEIHQFIIKLWMIIILESGKGE